MQSINVVKNLQGVAHRISAAEQQYGRPEGSVGLVAVSKTKSVALIREAWEAGQQAFGENYAQELADKATRLDDLAIEWHFIGPLQSNKTQLIANAMAWFHSLDRLKIARRLSEQRAPDLPPLKVCLQVNISSEESKAGVSPMELANLARDVATLPNIQLRGLMAIPEPTTDRTQQRVAFRSLRQLLELLQEQHPTMDTLSMGMSGDLEAAVAEGATLVRIGTDIFGAR
ncbi:MAG: YggS family pyridoxal phosphate-dependent enzyme [Cellvibrionales bacterium]|jgi:pyridoxal phosphate enzyme (YggS family)